LTRSRFTPYLVLLFGVSIAATSSILVRLAQESGAPSLGVAAWRLIFASLILTPLALRRRENEIRRLRRTDILWGAAAGIFLAVHLSTWIYSLEFTSVASSAALVSTNPLWIALAAFLIFGEHPSRFTMVGVIAAITGTFLIAFSDGGVLVGEPEGTLQFNWQNLAPEGKVDMALLGDALALIGAIMGSAYLLVGRGLRTHVSTMTYVWLVYTAGMIAMVIAMPLSGVPLFGYPRLAYVWIFLLAIGPQLTGHTSFNWALAHVSATFVALAILGEPLGSAIFAYFIFGEIFAPIQLV